MPRGDRLVHRGPPLRLHAAVVGGTITHRLPRHVDRRLIAETGGQHPHGTLAHGVGLQGRERARRLIDAVRRQTARCRPRGVDELPVRVQVEGAGHRLGRNLAERRQPPIGGHRKAGRLLLDSRVVDMPMASNPTFVTLSSLKPFFFNGLQNE